VAQEQVTKKYNTFVKGLITEASAINFPENASLDEANFHLHRDGSRERRLGVDYEDGYSKTTVNLSSVPTSKVAFYSWENVGETPDKNFLVVQMGINIDLFEHRPAGYGSKHTRFVIGVDTPSIPSPKDRSSFPFSFASVRGALFCAQAVSTPFYISYDLTTDTFSITPYTIKVRDIWGVPLGVATSITNRPTTLSGTDGWLHRYNLANQGWPNEAVQMAPTTGTPPVSSGTAISANPIDQTLTDLGYAPALADSYYLSFGLVTTPANISVYRPDMLTTNPLMSLRLPRGKFIIDAFDKDRADQLGTAFSGLEDKDRGTPTIVETFAGRLWYSGVTSSVAGVPDFDDKVSYDSTLFFSQIIESLDYAGKCYQENDPTSEEFSSLLATDGGTIELAGAGKIRRIIPLNNYLVVLADNGVWTVVGGQNGFTASSYSVRQVSNVGCLSASSVVRVEESVLYWSHAGIYAVQVDPQSRDIVSNNITENTIQTLYAEIPDTAKLFAHGIYNSQERHVSWLYPTSSTFDGINDTWTKDAELYYDLPLQAWSKYTISSLETGTPYILGAVDVPRLHKNVVQENVVADSILVEADSVQVETDVNVFSTVEKDSVYICGDGTFYTFGNYKSTSYLDWVTEDDTGISYESYLITGYETLEENARRKQATYISVFFNRTEENFIDDGADGAILDNQSGCYMQGRWDWSDHSNSGKWGNSQQVYRLTRLYTPTGTLPEVFDNGQPVVVTKNKLRGRGRSNHLKFTSEEGKDMHLLGWQTEYKGNKKA